VPAEEVMRSYRNLQQSMLRNPNLPKTQPRASDVAPFVREHEVLHGKRPLWKTRCEQWNSWLLTEPFKNWREFP